MSGISYEIISTPDAVSRGIEAYKTVYDRSWKASEPFPGFNPELIERTAQQGILRLGVCWRGDQPIAVQLWILAHGIATVMKLAHDENERSLSPGTVLTATIIKSLINEGITELNFGRGDDPYKQLWASKRRQCIGLIIANPRHLRGLAVLFRHDLGRRLRSAQRKILGWRSARSP